MEVLALGGEAIAAPRIILQTLRRASFYFLLFFSFHEDLVYLGGTEDRIKDWKYTYEGPHCKAVFGNHYSNTSYTRQFCMVKNTSYTQKT